MPPDPRSLTIDDDPTAWIGAWARSAALTRVVEAFGGASDPDADLGDLLAWLEAFAARWDYRRGEERNLVRPQEYPAGVDALVAEAAEALGMRGTTAPPHADYDCVVILGGLVRACLARPRYAARLLDEGAVRTARVVGLGGFRELKGDEHELVAALLDEDVTDEFHAMRAGIESAFGLGAPDATRGETSDVLGASWAVADYATSGGRSVHVVAAPSTAPGERRANTPDTYAWLADESGWLRRGSRVLLVTTAIYVPYQGADAVRMLSVPHGIHVDTVGLEPGDVDSRLAQRFGTHNYLQEVLSTVRSLRLLLEAVA